MFKKINNNNNMLNTLKLKIHCLKVLFTYVTAHVFHLKRHRFLRIKVHCEFSGSICSSKQSTTPFIFRRSSTPLLTWKEPQKQVAANNSSIQTHFDVGMTCGGCSGAVTRILKKVDGVSAVECDIESKRVTVSHDASVTKEFLFAKLTKWGEASGKYVRYGN